MNISKYPHRWRSEPDRYMMHKEQQAAANNRIRWQVRQLAHKQCDWLRPNTIEKLLWPALAKQYR